MTLIFLILDIFSLIYSSNNLLIVEGCEIDIIIKPKEVIDDQWLPMQLKATAVVTKYYGATHFAINHTYENILLFLHRLTDNKMYILDTLIKGSITIDKKKNQNMINIP